MNIESNVRFWVDRYIYIYISFAINKNSLSNHLFPSFIYKILNEGFTGMTFDD